MVQQNIDFIGGGFKLTLPYTFGGWILWVLGLIITGFGVAAAMTDPTGLGIAVIGLIVLAAASPGSMSAGLHKMRKEAIDPEILQAKAEQSGYSVDNWFLQQTTLVPTNDPNDWILPAPGPQTVEHANPYGPHGDGTPLPEHPVKVGTPQPATMTSHLVFAGTRRHLHPRGGRRRSMDEEAEAGVIPAIAIAGIGLHSPARQLLPSQGSAPNARHTHFLGALGTRGPPRTRRTGATLGRRYDDGLRGLEPRHGHAQHGGLSTGPTNSTRANGQRQGRKHEDRAKLGHHSNRPWWCAVHAPRRDRWHQGQPDQFQAHRIRPVAQAVERCVRTNARQAVDGVKPWRGLLGGAKSEEATAGPSTGCDWATRSTCSAPPNRVLLLNCRPKDWTERWATAPSKSGATRMLRA